MEFRWLDFICSDRSHTKVGLGVSSGRLLSQHRCLAWTPRSWCRRAGTTTSTTSTSTCSSAHGTIRCAIFWGKKFCPCYVISIILFYHLHPFVFFLPSYLLANIKKGGSTPRRWNGGENLCDVGFCFLPRSPVDPELTTFATIAIAVGPDGILPRSPQPIQLLCAMHPVVCGTAFLGQFSSSSAVAQLFWSNSSIFFVSLISGPPNYSLLKRPARIYN